MKIIRILAVNLISILHVNSLLYPQQNELRNLNSLDGLWTFVSEPSTACFDCESLGSTNRWYERDLSRFTNATRMPVPSAFNELTAEWGIREHVGWVWYQRDYRPTELLEDSQQILTFGSVQYKAVVVGNHFSLTATIFVKYVNGHKQTTHIGGHLPFQLRLRPLKDGESFYRITVAVDNSLHSESIPPGTISVVKVGNKTQIHATPGFDFFNYAGILRSVVVQTLNNVHLKRLQIWTSKPNKVNYNLTVAQPSREVDGVIKVSVCLYDPHGELIQCVAVPNVLSPLENPEFWWPRGYGKQPLYEMKILIYVDKVLVDVYRETFGFREVRVEDGRIYINDKIFYCQGFGMHEDSYLHGRGYDPVIMIRDLNMLEYMNANCYRTSHYPYNEERAYEADRRGFVVITEAPAVGIWNFNNKTLELHKQMIEEMIERDFNHPSVISWSLTNEPQVSDAVGCLDYFKAITSLARKLDGTRPVAAVFGTESVMKKTLGAAELVDIIGINTYIGWYVHLDEPDVIEEGVYEVVGSWRMMNKTLLVTEYGAEALPGYYSQPATVFSEQYQEAIIRNTHAAFDRLVKENAMSGEMIWNFADFQTAADTTRPFGNHKGVLTRDRQPKHSAEIMRKRYGHLSRCLSQFEDFETAKQTCFNNTKK
ncbi:Beta-glucuronidase [Aphelenchoides besseyi]|nr:Beta-glucuronidase [Aphelenchoides besseyi]